MMHYQGSEGCSHAAVPEAGVLGHGEGLEDDLRVGGGGVLVSVLLAAAVPALPAVRSEARLVSLHHCNQAVVVTRPTRHVNHV